MSEKSPDISIIIPFLNEETSLPRLVNALNDYLKTLPQSFEVVFVDDGSKDESVEILKNVKHCSYTSKLVKLSKNFGSHAALSAGILNASANLITFQFADLQDPLEILPLLIQKNKEGNDIVWACRNTPTHQNPFFSKMYGKLMRKYAVANYPDNGFDIAFFNKKVKNELNSNIENNSSIFLLMLSMGFKQSFVYYDKRERMFGTSKWTLSKKIKLVIDSFTAFSYAPIRFVTITGICLSTVGFLWMIYIIFYQFFIEELLLGFPAIICVLLLGFGITNISLGIIAEYLWRTLDSTRKRKAFIVDDVIALN